VIAESDSFVCFLVQRGDIKLFDLGMARDLAVLEPDEEGLYHLSCMTGSLRYMAPCVALGKRYNEACDVYSYAILLWQMLSLETPFKDHKGQQEFIEKVCIHGERPPIPNSWSKPLQQMLQSAWHDEYKQRPDMACVRRVLREELLRGCDSAADDLVSDCGRRRSTFVYVPKGRPGVTA